MRKIGLVVGILSAAIVLVLAGVWALFDVNRYRDRIQTALSDQLQRKVELGRMQLGLIPLRFQVENLAIADDPNFGPQAPFVHADKLNVLVAIGPLLTGNVKVDSLDLERPVVELVKNKQGVWNFSTLGGQAKPSAPSSPPPSGGQGNAVSLGNLTIRDGQIAITDLQDKGIRAKYDHIDVKLSGYAPGQPTSFDITAHIAGQGTQAIHLKGEGGPLSAEEVANTPLHGTLTLEQIQLAGLRQFLDAGRAG